MDQDTQLEVQRRFKPGGQPVVSPFINGYNVWDFEPHEWTYNIQQAILHAYELGWKDCNNHHQSVDNIHVLGKGFSQIP